jgi:hypothetical protein
VLYPGGLDDLYPELPGNGSWSKELGFDYDMKTPDFGPRGGQADVGRTITASWYMLVRESDASPKSFVCPSSSEVEFDGENSNGLDVAELWDFGDDPYKHVSYAMHNPYGKYPATGARRASFAVAGDMSPWFVRGEIVKAGANGDGPQLIVDDWSKNAQAEAAQIQAGNSANHDREGTECALW